jgi:hypothetical protein
MFIRQLNYLIALDKHRHFGRAAESCHVSKPALSNGIRGVQEYGRDAECDAGKEVNGRLSASVGDADTLSHRVDQLRTDRI